MSPGGKLKPGRVVRHRAGLHRRDPRGHRAPHAHRAARRATLPLDEAIERYGHIPLPPYIERADARERRRALSDGVSRARPGRSPRRRRGCTSRPSCSTRSTRAASQRAEVRAARRRGTFKPVEVDDPARARDARGVVFAFRRDRGGDATRDARGRRARVGGRHDERAHARERGGRRRARSRRRRRDAHLHPSAVRVSRRRSRSSPTFIFRARR